jgi:hypothetical protein
MVLHGTEEFIRVQVFPVTVICEQQHQDTGSSIF